MGLGRGYAGAAASAIASAKRAMDRYIESPKMCAHCGKAIPLIEGRSVHQVRVKKFCNASCSAKSANAKRWYGHQPVPKSARGKSKRLGLFTCKGCSAEYAPWSIKSKFCSLSCAQKSTPHEERVRRGRINSESARINRYKQLAWEENIAQEMRTDEWEVFSPTVVCDRVGIKDGKVFFLEFKPLADQRLRAGQQRIADLVPEMYRIIAK